MTAIEDYCTQHTSPLPDPLNSVYRSVALHTANPHMASSPYQGTLLQIITAIQQPEIAVEIGSQAGFGAVCIASGLSDKSTLHLIEINDEYQSLIIQHAQTAGVLPRIKTHFGPAANLIPTLPDGIDLAFIDADKENYDLYYTLLLPKMKQGGLILLDNMLWYGRVLNLDSQPSTQASQLRCNREAHAIHQLNQRITLDPRVDNILLPIRDGIMLCRIR